MTKITTALGELDLNYKPLEFEINDSEIGTKLKVKFEGIRSMTESGEFANIVWIVNQYDESGELLNPLYAVQDRQVVTDISGQKRVTADGVLIIRDDFPEGEVGDRSYQMAFNKGYNEYRFWMAMLRLRTLPDTISLAGQILAQFNRFHKQ